MTKILATDSTAQSNLLPLAVANISDLRTKTVNFSEFSLDNLPPLAVGIEHGNALLTTYEIESDIEDNPLFEFALTGLENKNPEQPYQVQNFARWLGGYKAGKNEKKGVQETDPVLKSIGGIPIKELAVASGKSIEDFILSMAFKDVMIISLAVRLTIKDGIKGFWFEQRCPIEGCEKSATELIASSCNLGDIEIGYPVNPTSTKYRVTLPKPVTTKNSDVLEYIDLRQIKLYEVAQYRKAIGTGESPLIAQMNLHSVQKLPDEFFNSSRKNTTAVSKAIESLNQIGTAGKMYPKCPCYRAKEYEVTYPWIQHAALYGVDTKQPE